MDALGRIIALDHSAYLLHSLLDGLSLADQNAGPVVPGVHRGTGHNQVTHTGKSAKGAPGTAQLLSQAGQLRHGPGHQQRLGVILKPQACADAAAEGHHIFHRRRQLHAHDVITGVDSEVIVHKGILDKSRSRAVWTGRHAARGHLDSHFFCMRRPRKRYYLTDIMGLLTQNFTHAQVCVPLNALGDRDQDALRPEIGGDLPPSLPHSKGRCRAYHHVRLLQTVEVAGDLQFFRQSHAFEQRVLPLRRHLCRLVGMMRPQPGLMPVVPKNHAQCRTPAAAAQYHRLHDWPSFFR